MGLSIREVLRPGDCGNFLGTGGEGNRKKMFTQFSMPAVLPADNARNLDSFNLRAKPSLKNSFWKLKTDNFSLELESTCLRQAAPSLGQPTKNLRGLLSQFEDIREQLCFSRYTIQDQGLLWGQQSAFQQPVEQRKFPLLTTADI